MIIRATTQEELREVLAYMCIYLGQTHITSDVTNVCILSYEDWLDVRP